MDYHLRPIEQFVSNYIKPNSSFIERLHKPFVDEVLVQITKEIEKVKINISLSYYAFDNPETGDHFIKNHQRRITVLINEISTYKVKRKFVSETMNTVLNELMRMLSELLKFLESEYGHCMDEKLFITHALGVEKAFEFSTIIAGFPAPFYYSDPLFKIAMEPIDTFIKGDKTRYNHRQLKYLTRLIKELDQLQKKIDFGFKVEIINLLICINFNNNAFFNFLTEQVLQDVHNEETINAQLLKLSYYQKHYRQKMSKSDIAFLPKRRNIRDQMVLWISEEINYLKSSSKLLKKNERKGKPMVEKKKFQLDLSVEQIAILIRVAKETNLLKVQELRSFSNFICEHFSTKKQETIAESSLYNKIYNYELEDPERIRTNIMEWINRIA